MYTAILTVAEIASFLGYFVAATGFKLTVLHTNDFHSRFEETNPYGTVCKAQDLAKDGCYGGVARRATEIKRIRAKENNVILLSAGDVFTGTLWYKEYRGNATWSVMNEMGYDAMTLGNHDFDDGPAITARFLRNIKCPVVVSNVNCTLEPALMDNGRPLILQSTILTVGGKRIGLAGYVTHDTPRISSPGPGQLVKFAPEVAAVQSAVDDLKRQGVNKIIVLGHAEMEVDKAVARMVDGVDLLVGGHTHTFLYSGDKPPAQDVPEGPYPLVVTSEATPGKKVPIVHAYKFGKYLGRLDVEFDDKGDLTSWTGNPVLLDRSVAKDSALEQQVQRMKGRVDKLASIKIGRSLVQLNGDRDVCWRGECNLGNVITDAMVMTYANKTATSMQWTGASVGLQTAGNIFKSIELTPEGYVTYGELFDAMPYSNTFDVLNMKGSDLRGVLEQSVRTWPSYTFLQVSGLKVSYDMSREPMTRVIKVKVRCAQCLVPVYHDLNDTGIYKVITNSWIAGGGSGFSVFKRRLHLEKGDELEADVVSKYIEWKSPIFTGEEGRVSFVTVESAARALETNHVTLLTLSLVLSFILHC
ncbi:predicted protein [Nematostella vectensis]|uniref:5'-nucleotidase n=1 Tax=Nematostella vectensis TaxID=45351 RepID=A7S2K3_NEMVE|nr:predicted protein [Nematostella vectensis]|eukprot:XP_001634079.1 predicted protein [Nematostella vectensis]